jgi:hypothetical protein
MSVTTRLTYHRGKLLRSLKRVPWTILGRDVLDVGVVVRLGGHVGGHRLECSHPPLNSWPPVAPHLQARPVGNRSAHALNVCNVGKIHDTELVQEPGTRSHRQLCIDLQNHEEKKSRKKCRCRQNERNKMLVTRSNRRR